MAEVYESVIKIETGDSELSVKQLKEDIKNLRDEILNLEKGTDEYDKAVNTLQDSQRKLDEVMSLTKKTATALDGSYDALVHQMGLLKKEWRATNDEARRNELGRQIDGINNQLKEMDASIGNHQRNVGNYEESIVNAYQRIRKEIKEYQAAVLNAEEGTEEWQNAMNKLSQAQFELRDMNEKSRYSVADFGEQLSNVTGIASGLMSGFSALQAVMVLTGGETEEFEKVMIKLQAAMALVQGLQGLEGIADRIAGLGTAVKTITKTMGKGGWIGVIIAVGTAITALTTHLVRKNREIKNGTAALKEYDKAVNENVVSISEDIIKIQLLERVSRDAASADEIRNTAAKELLETIGESVTETNILAVKNGDYADIIRTKVIPALIAQAKVEGALNLIKQKGEEIAKQRADVIEKEGAVDEAKANPSPVPNTTGGAVAPSPVPTTNVDVAEASLKSAEEKLKQMENDFQIFVNELMNGFDGKDILVALGITVDDNVDDVKNKVMGLQEALDLALNEIATSIEEDVKGLEDIEIEFPTIDVDEANKKLREGYQNRIKMAENAAKREIEYNNLAAEDAKFNAQQTIKDTEELNAELERIENERALKEADINLNLAETKQGLLTEWKEQNTDVNTYMLEIAQALADGEVEIAKAKFEKIKRMREKDTEDSKKAAEKNAKNQKKQWDATNDTIATVGASFQATGDILNALADMYEADGELSEKEAKKVKNLRIATATMDMLAGIVAALAGNAGSPIGWVLGGIQAATIATLGGINIAKIKNTDFNGGTAPSPALPSAQTYSSELPATYTRQITSSSEIERLNQEQKVYILESEIMEANRRVEIRQNESTF